MRAAGDRACKRSSGPRDSSAGEQAAPASGTTPASAADSDQSIFSPGSRRARREEEKEKTSRRTMKVSLGVGSLLAMTPPADDDDDNARHRRSISAALAALNSSFRFAARISRALLSLSLSLCRPFCSVLLASAEASHSAAALSTLTFAVIYVSCCRFSVSERQCESQTAPEKRRSISASEASQPDSRLVCLGAPAAAREHQCWPLLLLLLLLLLEIAFPAAAALLGAARPDAVDSARRKRNRPAEFN